MKKNTFRDIYSSIRLYGFNSMFLRNSAKMLGFVLLPVIIAFAWIFRYGDTLLNDSFEKSNTSTLYRVQAMLDMFVTETISFAETLYASADVEQLSNRVQSKYPTYATIAMRTKVARLIRDSQAKYMSNIYIYSAVNNHILTSDSAGPPSAFKNTGWIDSFYANYSQTNLPFFALSPDADTGAMQLYYYKPLRSSYAERQGFIAIGFSGEKLNQLLLNMDEVNTQGIAIINSDGQIVLANNEAWISQHMEDLFPGLEYGKGVSNSGQRIRSSDRENYLCNVVYSDVVSWSYLSTIPDNEFHKNMNSFYLAIVAVLCLCVFFATMCTMLISAEAFKPISLIRKMLNDPMRIAPDKMQNNELKQIVGTIYKAYSTEALNGDEVRKHIEMLNAARISALQAQITPHFLYNTLQAITIIFEKETGKSDSKCVELLEELSSLIRVTMQITQNIVPLADEIEYIKKYLFLQKARYGESLQIEIDIPEETRMLSVPKMSLQPIVENIFNHGNSIKKGHGHIRINAEVDGGFLIIKVTDNCGGMPEEKIRQLNDMLLSDIQFTDINIGLNNVNARLKLIFGASAGMSLAPDNGGLTVSIRVPLDAAID